MNPFPLEGIANMPGVPRLATVNPIAPPPTIQMAQPNQAIPNMPLGVSHEQNAIPSAPPVSGSVPTKSWESGDDPKSDYLAQAIKIYESIPGATAPRGSSDVPGYTGAGAPDDSSWRNRLYAERAANASGGSYAGGGGGTQGPRTPFQAIKSPDMPKFEGEKYNAPERDEGIYDVERQKAMGPGLRALREGTSEAISSAQSLDNPNARGKFIQQALQGYGQGLESVSAGASKEATNIADRRHSENVADYRIKFDYRRDEDLLNYKTEIGKIASDFAAESAANLANYNAGITDGSGAQNTGDARSKSTYYNDKTPNMGYFA